MIGAEDRMIQDSVRTTAPLARGPVLSAMAVLALALTACSNGYGFHRDELYFRMLEPAWGYVDQPPLTPLLVRAMTALVDEPWMPRLIGTLAAIMSVLVLALITREVGGGRSAQAWCAWSATTASVPLVMGHTLLTTSLDLVIWPAACLFAIRALLRPDPRWWPALGLLVGLSSYNKLLIVLLVLSLLGGLLLAGPRRVLLSPHVWVGGALAVLLALPNLIYQASNGWPQLAMGAALADNNADEVRVIMWPFLLLLLGPPLTVVWVTGVVALLHRPAWRVLRCLAVALPIMLIFTFISGAQFYYPLGLVMTLFAIGWVPVAHWLAVATWRRATAVVLIAVNAVVSAVMALPVITVADLGATPIPEINQVTRDSVGWPRYVEQIAAALDNAPADAVVITGNYGEAGAVARYGPEHGIDAVYSGHNQLWWQARPPDSATSMVFVGDQFRTLERAFDRCGTVATLNNDVGLDNEEQGQPITLCTGRNTGWDVLWPLLQHFD
jgi:hypothetical protein